MKYLLLLSSFIIGFYIPSNAQNAEKSWMGRTTGKLPSIAYGLGEDRLGGAKLGYIDTGVIVKVIDSAGDMYHVQLSKQHSAFIEKRYVEKDTLTIEKPYHLTNSWKAEGSGGYDVLSISMDEKLPYKSWMEIDPSKVMIELYGVQTNTNWITQLQSLKEIKNIYYNQVEDDVLQITVELKHRQHWGYSLNYKGKLLQLKVKRQPEKLDLRKLTIAIDAGHGGSNAGADGITLKASEKEYTLLFAKALEKQLKKQKVKVIMTRTTDTTFDMKDRILFLQEKNPDVLLSLHLNSSGSSLVKGSSTYYKYIGFRPLSQAILKRMLEIGMDEFGNVGNFNFGLNGPTDFINCLLEIAFLSNESDERKVVNPKFQALVARQIIKGLNDWLKEIK
ncbi:MAG: N-acetylmuramoyl-L-alanine amidase [Bacteroidota bacterium]|nr:N-acetylmuramoyl-L-alanine amidase [Bacteroidota bacterium]